MQLRIMKVLDIHHYTTASAGAECRTQITMRLWSMGLLFNFGFGRYLNPRIAARCRDQECKKNSKQKRKNFHVTKIGNLLQTV